MVAVNELLFRCYIVIFVIGSFGVAGNLLEFISHRLETGARMMSDEDYIKTHRSPNYKHRSQAVRLIEHFGYEAESYEVETEDGYLLTVHRIPHGRNPNSKRESGKPVVLIYHGILASSDSWLLRGPDEDLAYLLADNGYDVWLGNARGNVYSRKHVSLDPDRDKKFWEFSFNEIGYYDLPATIDHILNVTQEESLIYIGHSMGTTMFFVLCSTRPEYNSKIKLMHGLAPAVYIIHRPSPLMKLVISNTPALVQSFREQSIYELFPLRKFTGRLGRALCHKTAPTQPLCLAGVFLVAGVDYQQLNTTLLPKIFEHFPAGASINTFLHFYQNVMSGLFRHMDYGEEENMIRYQQKFAPDYSIPNVTAPIALYYGDGDYVVKREDTEMLASKLPNVVGVFKVPFPFFNHLDFLWGSDSRSLLYEQVLLITNKYR